MSGKAKMTFMPHDWVTLRYLMASKVPCAFLTTRVAPIVQMPLVLACRSQTGTSTTTVGMVAAPIRMLDG